MNSGTEAKNDAAAAAMAASTAAPSVATEPIEPMVTPVRSAKDAINAMYAQDADNRLSSYLAASAKEIINAGKTSGNQKSAANLHHGAKRRPSEIVHPSASSLIKPAKVEEVIIPSNSTSGMDPIARQTAPATPKRIVRSLKPATPPVVKTSLKLGPKKTPTTISPQNIQQNRLRRNTAIRNQKGSTALAEMLATRQPSTISATPTMQPVSKPAAKPTAAAQESIRAMQQAAHKTKADLAAKKPNVTRPKMRAPRGLMQDIVRPTTHVAPAAPTEPEQAAASRHPLDSVKRRFRAAPKGYAATAPETQSASYTGYEVEDTIDAQPPQKPPVEIYGLMDEEPTGKRADGLGVVEDYHPKGGLSEQKVAQGSGKASPDNNKYALGGQSPFFLKSVNVEKRPLSDAPTKRSKDAAGTLYEKPGDAPIARKNVYNVAADTNKKALPTKPTVIIPASRRSKAPLVFLLLLTVALGAAVGGFAYLCFFQYME